jgi:hypothetical protein
VSPQSHPVPRQRRPGQGSVIIAFNPGTIAEWRNRQAFRPLLQFGRGRRLSPALIEFAELPFFMGLPFAAPPGLPADRAGALRAGRPYRKEVTFVVGGQQHFHGTVEFLPPDRMREITNNGVPGYGTVETIRVGQRAWLNSGDGPRIRDGPGDGANGIAGSCR